MAKVGITIDTTEMQAAIKYTAALANGLGSELSLKFRAEVDAALADDDCSEVFYDSGYVSEARCACVVPSKRFIDIIMRYDTGHPRDIFTKAE